VNRAESESELVVLCPHFRPDVAPTGEVMSSIADGLIACGRRLHIITALPWYLSHRVEPGWERRLMATEELDWGRITRVHPFPTDKTNIPARALAFAGFTALSTLVGLVTRGPVHGVLAMSPPITLGVAGLAVARRHRAPFVFNIQDVFPDVAIELGVLRSPRLISIAQGLERFLYRNADVVTVLSEDLAENVRAKIDKPGLIAKAPRPRQGTDRGQVRVIPNFVDTDRIRPTDPDNAYRREYGLVGKTVVMYAGNVGLSQSLDMVLDAAKTFVDQPDVVFVINGGGSARTGLMAQAKGMTNVRFVGLQPPERVPEVLAAADVHVVPLKRGLARSSVPSKLYSILAAGRPIVASVDVGTEVARVIADSDAGLAVPSEDTDAFVEALHVLVEQPSERIRLGRNGRSFVEGWASPAAVAESYATLFDELSRKNHRVLSKRDSGRVTSKSHGQTG